MLDGSRKIISADVGSRRCRSTKQWTEKQGGDRVFAALGQDGQIQMPLAKTFWSPRFGMLTDRFGVAWMVTVAAQPTDVAALKTNLVPETLT